MVRHVLALRGASACAIFAAAYGPRPVMEMESGSGGGGSFGRAMVAAAFVLLPVMEMENGGGGGSPEKEMIQLAKDFKVATDEVKSFAEKATTELKNLGKITDETKTSADKALTDMNSLSARVTEVEQKIVQRGNGTGPDESKSIGHRFVENDEVKAAMGQGMRFRGRVSVEVKNITSASTTGASATTGLVVADRQPGVISLPNRGLVVRDLLMPGRTASGSIEYVRENVLSLNAATVAENPSAAKPQSDITYLMQNTPVRTVAHFIMASKQILDDAPQLQSQIDGRLRYGLSYVEDLQLLAGDGTGTNLLGLLPQASAYAAPAGVTVTGETKIDRLRLAMLQAVLALYPATGHVLHPTDWASIELTKDSQGRYIWANPAGLIGPTMWGLPVVESLAMTQNHFLTGAFKMAAQIFDREDANVLISTEDTDNFRKNMVTILAEERLALAVYRPAALITGTFPVVA
ncbi:phage major capsid protein [Lichenihabitans psoromatis]|uniref:phage major capsid protein n=1 Tax=Lichenihabitans psoromatis TaxID=2528642 RepID=UPI001FE1B7ED|nr:phage major capsid protein [Lichenihabitans psoromatis]